jgi:predicted transcriptional regulator
MDEEPLPNAMPPQAVIAARELDLVSELFHQINRVLPADQNLLTLPPEMCAREAIGLLWKHRFSQAPVVEGGSVLGVFSFRSFARRAAEFELKDLLQQKNAPGDFLVEDCVEQFDFARVTNEMQQVFDAMERDNGVLVGTPERLQGILTPMDFLRYLYKLASPFVLVSEIELALRALIRLALTPDQLSECALRSLRQHFETADKVPRTLEAMTFDNYRQLIAHGDNWPLFAPILGANRNRAAAKLKEIGDLRNDLFHFKREISVEDHEVLSEHRNWLLLQARKAELRGRGGQTQ